MVPSIDQKDFFISYTKSDQKWAEWIAEQLEKEKYSTVIQAWDFTPGENFILNMNKAAINCKSTIVVLSKNYFDSLFTQSEWAAAFVQDPKSEKRMLVPIRVEDYKPEGLFKAIIYIDLVGLNEDEAKKALIGGIAASNNPRTSCGFPGITK